jgi:hypothetical protein
MKAKIKKTGEIINVVDYSTVKLNKCDRNGDNIEIPIDEVEIINEPTDKELKELEHSHGLIIPCTDMPSDKRMRYELAKAAMHAILTGDFYKRNTIYDNLQYTGVSREAIEIADEMIKQLKESEANNG